MSEQTNPLLQRIRLPGETFPLPSGGLFYGDGILDPSVTNAEIHVHPMTALDEIVMKTPDLLFSGKAVDQVFARCIPHVLKPSELLAKDVDFLLTCLRKISYGDEMQVDYKHSCPNAKTHTYAVSVSDFIRNAKRIDPTSITKDFSVDFPNGQKAKIQPIKFSEFVNLMQSMNTEREDEMTPEKLRDAMIDTIADIVVSVDEVTDRRMIREWLMELSPQYLTLINNKLNESSDWGPDFDVTVTCKDCGEQITFTAPLNPLSFFT
jgi:hypothetical protein